MIVLPISQATLWPHISLPFFDTLVNAGFPSPVDSLVDTQLDLNRELIAHPTATFVVRAKGESMKEAGILDGDHLIVDRAVTPRSGDVVIAVVENEFLVKRFLIRQGHGWLVAANADHPFQPLAMNEHITVWGVVTHAIHSFRG